MDKTHFSSICTVLGELWLDYREQAKDAPEWDEYFAWADVALPLAYMKNQNLVTGLKEPGKQYILEAWDIFCKMIEIDPDNNYDGVIEAFEMSPNMKPIS